MLVAALDFEATDKIPETARITEIGAVLFNEAWEPQGELSRMVYDPSYPPQSEEVIRVTGITDDLLKGSGIPPREALEECLQFLGRAQYVVAYNVDYDRVLLEHEMARLGMSPQVPRNKWVCALRDVPYPEYYTCRKLSHLALDHGCFFDPNGLHRAVNDVKLMGTLLAKGGYTLAQMLAYQAMPTMVVRAIVSFNDKDLAKARRYSWEKINDKVYPKMWVRAVKEDQVAREIAECKKAGFQAAVIAKI